MHKNVVKVDFIKQTTTILIENVEKNEKVTFLQITDFNKRYLLVGYENGKFEIRDVRSKKILFEEKGSGKIIDLEFMSDLFYGALSTVTEDGSINIYILEHDKEKEDGSFKHGNDELVHKQTIRERK